MTSIVVFLSEADAGEDERISEDLFSEADECIHCRPLMSSMICSGVSSTSVWLTIRPVPHAMMVMSVHDSKYRLITGSDGAVLVSSLAM